jgi:hypothetical protein
MARYNPLDLSTQLCHLFDSRKVRIEEFSRESGCSAEYIERLTNRPATKIDWATRHAVGKALSHYHRLFPDTRPPSQYDMEQRRLRLVDEADNELREGTPRGVFEEPDAPPGTRIFKSIGSDGIRRERREVLASDLSRQTERRIRMGMEAYLDFVDPVELTETGDT